MSLHTLAKLVLLSILVQLGYGSAAFVYEDIQGYPRYHVMLTTQKIPQSQVFPNAPRYDESAIDQILIPNTPVEQEEEKSNTVMMMSSSGQPFLCTIPNVEKQDQPTESSTAEEPTKESIQKSIDHALKLLEPLSKRCLYFTTNSYWTYEYCHMKHVRQFHIDRTQIQVKTGKQQQQLDNGPSFLLGVFGDTTATQSEKSKQTALTHHTAQKTPSTTLRHVGDKRYLVQQWNGGTTCDLTGKPRSIEIQYHCDLQMHDRIAMFQEVATCQYQMIIATPRLCDEMMLASQKRTDVHTIECHPVVDDEIMGVAGSEEDPEDQADEELALEEDADTTDKEAISDESPTSDDNQPDYHSLIAGLTSHIEELKQQLRQPREDDPNADQDFEMTFFHMDENGQMVPSDSRLLKETLEPYVKALFAGKEISKQAQREPTLEQSIEEKNEKQNRNKKAYDQVYHA